MTSGVGDVGDFCFLTFLLILRYPMKCDLLFFLLHNLSQAELRVERKVICTKRRRQPPTPLKKNSLSSGVGDRM